jgi:phage shock protein A
MAILERIHRIARANMAQLLDRVESPEDEITSHIRALEDAAREAKDALAGFAVTVKRQEQANAALRKTRDEWQARAEVALQVGDEPQARRALGERLRAEARLASLEPVLESRQKTYDELRDDLVRIHDQLSQARAQLMDLRARKLAAEAAKNMSQQVATLDRVSPVGLDRLEDEVMAAEAAAEIDREMRGVLTPLSDKLAQDAQSRKIDGELAALKARLGKDGGV